MRLVFPMVGIGVAAFTAGAFTPAYAQSPTVTQKTLKQTGPKRSWTFSYKYPTIAVPGALMGVQGICRDFNQRMEKEANQSLAAFKQQVAENGKVLSPVKTGSERGVTYSVAARTQNLVAVKFTQFEYMRGAAHPTTTSFTRNFAMQGRFLSLKDVFKPGSKYLETISTFVGKDLNAQAKAKKFEIFSPQGFAPRIENFSNFLITRGGLTVLFDPAEIAAYAVGPLTSTVPWTALDADLSPLARTLKGGL